MRGCQLEARDGESPANAACANDDLSSLQPQTALGFDRVRIDKVGATGAFVDGHLKRVDLGAQCRMRTHIVDDCADALQQPGIVQHRLAHGDAECAELAGVPDQASGLSECPYRNRSIIGGHAAEFVTCYERRLGAKIDLGVSNLPIAMPSRPAFLVKI